MEQKQNTEAPQGAVPLDCKVRRFQDLPLGTRFSYPGYTDVWVLLERHGCGKVARWQGLDGLVAGQAVCSFADTPEECATLKVIVHDA